jgi:16S rRNA processing protein RimM
MTEPSDGQRPVNSATDSWEQRAAGVANEVQRWLIRKSARNMRDELGGQVKKALRGSERSAGDTWATATTEPPHAADEAPECAWCPVCRAARRMAQARSGADARGGGPKISDAADVMAGAVRDALAGIDSISDAETLIRCELQVPEAERAELEPGSTYVSDLVGCTVFDGDREIGQVRDVQFGAGEAPLLMVSAGSAGSKDKDRDYEIPYAEAYLSSTDLEHTKIHMRLPEGMLELNAPLTAEEKEQQRNNKKPS